MDKYKRIQKANDLLEKISSCGRCFFKHKNNVSKFLYVKNRLNFYDKYSEEILPLSHPKSKRWGQKFTEGGTLFNLILTLAEYIKTGKKLRHHFGPWPDYYCKGDLWGYGESMEVVRQYAIENGIHKEDE